MYLCFIRQDCFPFHEVVMTWKRFQRFVAVWSGEVMTYLTSFKITPLALGQLYKKSFASTQSWRIWVNRAYSFIKSQSHKMLKHPELILRLHQKASNPFAYFMGYNIYVLGVFIHKSRFAPYSKRWGIDLKQPRLSLTTNRRVWERLGDLINNNSQPLVVVLC